MRFVPACDAGCGGRRSSVPQNRFHRRAAWRRGGSAGPPFVGPAGRLFDRALADAGIDRSAVYITNAVKHFKFEERGKRRIHKKPSLAETRACRPWLEAEISIIRPDILVCLGATAAQSVFGNDYRLTKSRGQFVQHPWALQATSTIHPSAVLRAPKERRQIEYQGLVEDLKKVRAAGTQLNALR